MQTPLESLKNAYSQEIVHTTPEESSEIRIILDTYDDIFSDFDPRDYDVRAMSTDFLEEIERASADKQEGGIELNLLIPKKVKSTSDELVIKKRLHEHFIKHYHHLQKEKENLIKEGLWFIIGGLIFMFVTTYFLYQFEKKTPLITFLTIICEPGGWFLFWEGLNLLIFETKRVNPKLSFYKKMHLSKINFFGY